MEVCAISTTANRRHLYSLSIVTQALQSASGNSSTVVVSVTIPPPFGKVPFYLNIPWMYDNKQYENNDEKE
jgi:hypothetical protein